MLDDKADELVTEVVLDVQGEILDPGINFGPVDDPWEDEGRDR